jgi:hypothetical protein
MEHFVQHLGRRIEWREGGRNEQADGSAPIRVFR